MYSANDLYAMTPESINKDVGELKGFYYDHLPEIEENLWDINNKNELVEIKVLKDFDFDGRRCWTLRTVWFNNKPVMVIQNAGREGDDHRERFVTNKKKLNEMVCYLKSLQDVADYCEEVDADVKYKCLTSFYGNDLDGKFERY